MLEEQDQHQAGPRREPHQSFPICKSASQVWRYDGERTTPLIFPHASSGAFRSNSVSRADGCGRIGTIRTVRVAQAATIA